MVTHYEMEIDPKADTRYSGTLFVQELDVSEVMKAQNAKDAWDAPHDPAMPLSASPGARAFAGGTHKDLYDGSSIRNGRTAWYGGLRSLSEANAMLRDGWAKGHAKTSQLCIDLGSELEYMEVRDNRRRNVWGDEGDLDADRFLDGDLDRAFRRKKRRGKSLDQAITLYAPWNASSSRKAEELFWQGATAIALADIMQDNGYSVELNAVSFDTGEDTTRHIVNVVRLKEGDELLRPEIASAFLCHAGVYRTIGFQAYCSNLAGNLHYGLTTPHAATDLASCGFVPDQGYVIGRAYSRDAAITEVKKALISLNLIEPNESLL